MDEATRLFDYGETRDLLKAFINLISVHDRVVGPAAKHGARSYMLWTWGPLFLSLALAGVALCAAPAAAPCVLYGPAAFPRVTCSVSILGYGSWILTLLAGLIFITSSGTMILAARLSVGRTSDRQ